jgi:hypothetical protein
MIGALRNVHVAVEAHPATKSYAQHVGEMRSTALLIGSLLRIPINGWTANTVKPFKKCLPHTGPPMWGGPVFFLATT